MFGDAQGAPAGTTIAIASPRTGRRTAWLVAAIYAALVLIMWLPFGPRTGWINETRIIYESQSRTAWQGFTLREPMRERGGIFYQVAYLLGSILTVPGDFTLYQVVYAALWWARGFLTFLILRRLVPAFGVLAYLAGALVLTHASDLALQSATLLNLAGMFVWMLLSFYALIRALQFPDARQAMGWTAAASACLYLALWSYESELLIVIVFPVLALAALRPLTRRRLGIAGAYWAVSLAYVAATVFHYSRVEGTYQQGALQVAWSARAMLSDLAYLARNSLAFWDWMATLHPVFEGWLARQLAIGAALLVIAGACAWDWFERRTSSVPASGPRTPPRLLAATLAAGLLLLVLSFPAYLILQNSRDLWRTQMLSGFGAALTMVSATGLIVAGAGGRRSTALAAAAVAILSAFGTLAAVRAGAFHYQRWHAQRVVMADVLRLLPGLRARSVVVLVGVPSVKPGYDLTALDRSDPFGDAMWFDAALRIAFPGARLTGQYYLDGGFAAPGSALVLRNGQWVPRDGRSFLPLAMNTSLANTVFIAYGKGGKSRILRSVPSFVTTDVQAVESYDPEGVVHGSQVVSPTGARWFLSTAAGASR